MGDRWLGYKKYALCLEYSEVIQGIVQNVRAPA